MLTQSRQEEWKKRLHDEKWFNGFVSMFLQGILEEEHLPLISEGVIQTRLIETITRLRSAKSARSAQLLGKRDRSQAELAAEEGKSPAP